MSHSKTSKSILASPAKRQRCAVTELTLAQMKPGSVCNVKVSAFVAEIAQGSKGPNGPFQLVILVDDTGYLPMWLNKTNLSVLKSVFQVGRKFTLTIKNGTIEEGKRAPKGDKFYVPSMTPYDLDVFEEIGYDSIKIQELKDLMDAHVKFFTPNAYVMILADFIDAEDVKVVQMCPDCGGGLEVDVEDPDDFFCSACNTGKGYVIGRGRYQSGKIVVSDGIVEIKVMVFASAAMALFGDPNEFEENSDLIAHRLREENRKWLIKKQYSYFKGVVSEGYVLCWSDKLPEVVVKMEAEGGNKMWFGGSEGVGKKNKDKENEQAANETKDGNDMDKQEEQMETSVLTEADDTEKASEVADANFD